MGRQGRSRLGGVTLIELVVVLALGALMHSLGAPALSDTLDSMRLTAGTNTLFSSVVLARSEAVKRKGRVVLCKSATGDACASTGNWEQGWIVFHDANNNAAFDAGEALVSREPALNARVRVKATAPVENYVSYAPDGSTRLTSGAFQAGTLTLCLRSIGPVVARSIVIYKSGRPRTSRTTVQQCD